MDNTASQVEASPPVRKLDDNTYVIHVRTSERESSENVRNVLSNLRSVEVVREHRSAQRAAANAAHRVAPVAAQRRTAR